MTSDQTGPNLSADLLLPAGTPTRCAVYGYRTHGPAQPATALLAALAAQGITTLTVDLDRCAPPGRTTPAEDQDITTLRRAADRLGAAYRMPLLLLGHSAAGPPVLAAAAARHAATPTP